MKNIFIIISAVLLISCSKEDEHIVAPNVSSFTFTVDGVNYVADNMSVSSAFGVTAYLITGSVGVDNTIQIYLPSTELGSFTQDDSLYNISYLDYIDSYDYHGVDEEYIDINSMSYQNYPVLGYSITVESFKNESGGIVSGSFNGSLFNSNTSTKAIITNGIFNIVLDNAVVL